MQVEQLEDFTQIMRAVAEQYSKQMTDNLIALYWQGLQDFDLPAVKDALGRHLRSPDNGQFMPKIADIIKMLQGSSQDAAFSAWSKVDKAVRRVGPYESVAFDDQIIHRVLHDMGGWIFLCEKRDDEWPFIAREFENRYRGFKALGSKIEYPAKLIGIYESHNAKEGHKVAPTMLIGDSSKAQSVMQLGSRTASLLGFSRSVEEMLTISESKIGGAE